MRTDKELRAYRSVVRAIAIKLSRNCPYLLDDLVQEGLTRVWTLRKTQAKTNRPAMLRQAAKFAMIDHLRSLHPDRFMSFEEARARGYGFETAADGRLVGVRGRKSAKAKYTVGGFRVM